MKYILSDYFNNNNRYFDIKEKEHHTWIMKTYYDIHSPNIQFELLEKPIISILAKEQTLLNSHRNYEFSSQYLKYFNQH